MNASLEQRLLEDVHGDKVAEMQPEMKSKEAEKIKKKIQKAGKDSINDFVTTLVSEVLPMVLPMKDVDKYKKEIKEDIFMPKTIETLIPEVYLQYGNYLGPLSYMVKIASNVDINALKGQASRALEGQGDERDSRKEDVTSDAASDVETDHVNAD